MKGTKSITGLYRAVTTADKLIKARCLPLDLTLIALMKSTSIN